MKKCPGCEREIDKLAIACQYCGKVSGDENETKESSVHEHKNDLDKEN